MKSTVSVKALKSAVDSVSYCVPTKPLMPILAGIKLDFDMSGVTITAFDLANGAQVYCEAENDDELNGISIVVDKKNLSSLLSKLSGDIELSIDSSLQVISLASDNSVVELQLMDAAEYPSDVFDTGDLTAYYAMPVASFKRAIDCCAVSASTDPSRQLLQGVNIQYSDADRAFKLASTDGNRLTICTIPAEVDDLGNKSTNVTVPALFLANLPKTISDTFDVSCGDTFQLTNDESSRFASRIYDGAYPDYSLLIPLEYSRTAIVDRLELLKLLNIADAIDDKSTDTIKLAFKLNSLGVSIERGAAKFTSSMDCKLTGAQINIGVRLKFLLDCVKMLDDAQLVFEFNGALQPIVVRSLDGLLLHLIMPIALKK